MKKLYICTALLGAFVLSDVTWASAPVKPDGSDQTQSNARSEREAPADIVRQTAEQLTIRSTLNDRTHDRIAELVASEMQTMGTEEEEAAYRRHRRASEPRPARAYLEAITRGLREQPAIMPTLNDRIANEIANEIANKIAALNQLIPTLSPEDQYMARRMLQALQDMQARFLGH